MCRYAPSGGGGNCPELHVAATGVEVTDSLANSVQFVVGSFSASRGAATLSGNVIKWNIGNISASPDTVTLTYKVKAIAQGVHFNTAEISKTNEKDVDSTPNNGKSNEDDIDYQCFIVPFTLCTVQKIRIKLNFIRTQYLIIPVGFANGDYCFEIKKR